MRIDFFQWRLCMLFYNPLVDVLMGTIMAYIGPIPYILVGALLTAIAIRLDYILGERLNPWSCFMYLAFLLGWPVFIALSPVLLCICCLRNKLLA